jgi:uncharacterized protein (DUF736 family)
MSNEQKKNDWQERELGALWVKKSDKGSQYMTGHIELKGATGKVQLVVFKNKGKRNEDGSYTKSEKAPDFRLFLSESREEREAKAAEQPSTAAPQEATAATSSDDEIMF